MELRAGQVDTATTPSRWSGGVRSGLVRPAHLPVFLFARDADCLRTAFPAGAEIASHAGVTRGRSRSGLGLRDHSCRKRLGERRPFARGRLWPDAAAAVGGEEGGAVRPPFLFEAERPVRSRAQYPARHALPC